MIKNEYTLEDTAGAVRFGEAYPLGNGHMGAMVYGGLPQNVIVLTENTFFSGNKSEDNLQKGAAQSFRRMRRAASAGKYDEVHREAEGFIGIRNDYGTNLPAAKLNIMYDGKAAVPDRLRRSLDIRDGIMTRSFCLKDRGAGSVFGVAEEYFISHPDSVMMIRIESEQPTDIRINAEGFSEHFRCAAEGNALTFQADAFELMHCGTETGVSLIGRAAIDTDGSMSADGKAEVIRGMTFCIISVRLCTDYKELTAEPGYAAAVQQMTETERFDSMRERYKSRLQKSIDYHVCHARHIEDMHETLGGCGLRIAGHEKESFLFAYGRYLLNASSRADSLLPAHLQGIWNDNVACRIGWTCDMHLDINTQMNYWIAETGGLPGTLPPLFDWIERALVPEGRKTAKEAYGCKGWVGEIVSNAWGYAAPYWASPIAPCPTGGIWILTHMWEHYLFTKDRSFLEKEAFPLISEAAGFFSDYIFEENGALVGGPSVSPENSFEKDGIRYQLSNGCTYEILMIRELFSIYLRACDELEPEDDILREKVKAALPRLLPYRILPDGTIAEYAHDLKVPDGQHRHTSHLLGLFPFAQITPEGTPELAEAAEKTVASRLTPEDSFEETGWARSLLLLYEARLQHPEKAGHHICCMLERLLEPNGMIIHPPTRGAAAFDNVYELDGNTGLAAGIAEMLLQSHNGVTALLPALPEEWADGEVRGLHGRGGTEISMSWKQSIMTEAVIKAASDVSCTIRIGSYIVDVKIMAGKQAVIRRKGDHYETEI